MARVLAKRNKNIWNDALLQLRKSALQNISRMQKDVSLCIELCYNYVENEETKSCLLLCCLFPEDYDIPIEYLVRYGVGLGLLHGVDSLGQARIRVHTIVDNLTRSFLLLDGNEKECVKMHDVVRDVAISIASKDNHMFLVRCDAKMKDWPKQDICKHHTAISLVYERYFKYADGLEYPKLELLQLMCSYGYGKFPDNFFGGMREMKVLCLEGRGIQSLPPSLQLLKNLRTLCLERKNDLRDISVIGVLEKLEILSFAFSGIAELPREIGLLGRLRLLDLRNCWSIESIAPGVLSNLSQLEELYMGHSFYRWGNTMGGNKERKKASLLELNALSHLMALEIDVWLLEAFPRDIFLKNLIRFNISNRSSGLKWHDEYLFPNTLKLSYGYKSDIIKSGIVWLLTKTEVMRLKFVKNLKNVVSDLDKEGLPHLKVLKLYECPDVEYVLDARNWALQKNAFPLLEKLLIRKSKNLKKIWCGRPLVERSFTFGEGPSSHAQLPSFGNLRFLQVHECHKLKNVLSLTLATCLVHLRQIEVDWCQEIEEIFLGEGRTKERRATAATDDILFPKLTYLKMSRLQKLVSFCKGMDRGDNQVTCSRTRELSSAEIVEMNEIPQDQIQDQGPLESRAESMPTSHKLFSSQWMHQIPNLEQLTLQSCHSVEVVFDLSSNIDPALAHLDQLQLIYLRELTIVWKNEPQGFLGFQNLRILKVERCDSLKNLFSPSIITLLMQLQELKVLSCEMMENIVTGGQEGEKEIPDMIVLPKVKLELEKLPNLMSFCPEIYTFLWPCLKNLRLSKCREMKTLGPAIPRLAGHNSSGDGLKPAVQHADFSCNGSSPLRHSSSLSRWCCGGASFGPTTKHGHNTTEQTKSSSHCKGEDVILTKLKDSNSSIMDNVPSDLKEGLQHLEVLDLDYCDSLEVVFDLEQSYIVESDGISAFNESQQNKLSGLPKLTHVWKTGLQRFNSFQSLKLLLVNECNGLRNLFPPSIIKLLVNLEEIKVCMQNDGRDCCKK